MTLKLELPHYDIATQSPNKTRGVHWSKRAKARKTAAEHAFVALCNLPAGEPRYVTGRVEIVVTRWMGARSTKLDPGDNAPAACKPLIDALVRAQVIEDDSSEFVASLVVKQERAAGKSGTTVEIRSANERAPTT